jgi:hypothetical protein
MDSMYVEIGVAKRTNSRFQSSKKISQEGKVQVVVEEKTRAEP